MPPTGSPLATGGVVQDPSWAACASVGPSHPPFAAGSRRILEFMQHRAASQPAGSSTGAEVATDGTPAWGLVWDPAGVAPDPRRTPAGIEGAIRGALGRNTRLRGQRITATAGPQGLVTLTGAVATQELCREVELICWTVPGVLSLHNDLKVGR